MSAPFASPAVGFLSLGVFAFGMIVLARAFAPARFGLIEYLLAGRALGAFAAGASIAATWIWAPALFIAAQKAYTQGFAGVFWFTVPNVLCLVLFGWFAARVRDRFPAGYTLSAYMGERYESARVQGAYAFQLAGLSVCSFAVQLLAGGYAVHLMTGIGFTETTVALTLIALSYSLFSGLRASVLTDFLQMGIILAVAAVVVPLLVSAVGSPGTILAGFGGPDGGYTDVMRPDVLLAFGIPVTVGLLSGPFGDQAFWQRAFAIREGHVFRAFLIGAGIFALVPLALSIPGFLAGATGFDAANPSMVGLEMVMAHLPAWAVLAFGFMLLCGLVSTMDSCLCAVSSLAGYDGARARGRKGSAVADARAGMLALAVGGLLIAHIPGLEILHLFLFYGTLRAATLLPTVLTILDVRLSERGVFWGVVSAAGIGLPVFAYGKLAGAGLAWTLGGSLGTVFGSAAIALALTYAGPSRTVRG